MTDDGDGRDDRDENRSGSDVGNGTGPGSQSGSASGGTDDAGGGGEVAPEPPDPEAAARLSEVIAGNPEVDEEIDAVFDGRAENVERITRAVARSMYLAGYDQAMEDVRNSMAGEGSPQSEDDLSAHLSASFDEDYERLLENLTSE